MQRAATASRVVDGTSVEYRRPGIAEWYQRSPRGVEHGFTLERSLCADGDIEMDVAVNGFSPRLASNGVDAEFLDERGAVRMHYTDLRAWDALGKDLSAVLSVERGLVVLRVSARSATYPVTVDPELWTQQGPALLSKDGAADDYFGEEVAISGDTVAVTGAPGAAYVFTRTGSAWAHQAPPVVPAGTFALSADTMAIGYSQGDPSQYDIPGAVAVYGRTPSGWVQQGPSLLVDTTGFDWFGASIAISGDTMVVGAPSKQIGGDLQVGAAYVFVRSGTTWTQQGPELTAPGGTALDHFGGSVAISKDTLVVGAQDRSPGLYAEQGAAYVFVRDGTSWVQQAMLTDLDAPSNKHFGASVAISGDTVAVGSHPDPFVVDPVAAATVFVRSGTTWSAQGPPVVTIDHVPSPIEYATAVALSEDGNTLVLGSDALTDGIAGNGAGYIFSRTGTTWKQQGAPLRSPVAGYGNFGEFVAISGNTVVFGAPLETPVGGNVGQGAAYIFTDGPCAIDAQCPAAGYCSGGVCVARCQHDSDCDVGAFCSANGVCQPKAAQGAACNEEAGGACREAGCSVCATGNCADGVCCDTPCKGVCQACAATLTGGVDGKCASVSADQDPHGDCATDANYPASCMGDGTCNGRGACRQFARSGTACGDTTCAAGIIDGAICDGMGKCVHDQATCDPYVCSGATCSATCTNDADCDSASGYCFNSVCLEKKPLAVACTENTECTNGFCADGVCCESVCDGQCEACAEHGTEGKCVPIAEPPCGAETDAGVIADAGGATGARNGADAGGAADAGGVADSGDLADACADDAGDVAKQCQRRSETASTACGCRMGARPPQGTAALVVLILARLHSKRRRERRRARSCSN